MASLAQIENLHKCKNKTRHKWVDDGKEKGIDTYCYTCNKCGATKIMGSMYSASYTKDGVITSTAPDCIEAQQ